MILVPENMAQNVGLATWAGKVLEEELEAFGFDRNGNPLFQTLAFTVDNKLACVMVAHQYRRPNVFLSIGSTNPRWATRTNIGAVGKWLFEDLHNNRISAYAKKQNKRSRKLMEGIGFKYEGNMRGACTDGDIIMYGLLKEDHQQWLRKAHGQRLN